MTGEEIKAKQYFSSLDDLSKVPEFQNFGDEKAKTNFKKLVAVRSDVFSIYLTARLVQAEGSAGSSGSETQDVPGELVRRVRAVTWRRAGQSGAEMLPIVRWEVRADRKLELRDFSPDNMPRH